MNTKLVLVSILFFTLFTFSCKKSDHPPFIGNQSFSVPENSPDGTVLGIISAFDPDNDKISYKILAVDSSFPFTINENTGELSVQNGKLLDFETTKKYEFVVQVFENSRITYNASATITVNLTDVAEMPLDGLVAFYGFNGNANEENNLFSPGFVSGAILTTDRKGNSNSAYLFNGVDDNINLSWKVCNYIRSISVWFQLDVNINGDISSPYTILARDGDYNNYCEFSLAFITSEWGTGGELRFQYEKNKDDYYNVYSNNNNWQKGKWYHVVISIDENQGMLMYIDNVLQNSVGNYYSPTEYSPLNTTVGSWGLTPDRNFPGKIDDLAFYNRSLNSTEVKMLYLY